jgi:acyl carrier protein
MMDALPRTEFGKLDRSAFRRPDASAARGYSPPSTALENGLAEIWAEILGSDRISIHDDFFELGGHSLMALQMISRIRRDFGIEIPIRSFFESPSIAALSNMISANGEWPGSKSSLQESFQSRN